MSAQPPSPPDTPFTSAVDFRSLPWTTPLARDYCHAFDRLEPFYAGDPAAPDSWRDAIEARRAASGGAAEIAGVLSRQLRARNAPSAALTAAARLAEPGAVAVLTGQQAGLFGGPLFTLLKALTAIALARRVESEHGVRATPIFWVDAEDHDLDEVRTCSVLDADLAPHRLALDLASESGRPAAAVRLPAAVAALHDELRRRLPPTEFSDAVLGALAGSYAPGAGMVEAFARWLDFVAGGHGLVVFDASDAAAKPLAQPVFDRELRLRGETSRLAAAAGAALLARGYHAQVTPPDDAVALFGLDGARLPIRRRDDAFVLGETPLAPDDLADRVRRRPAEFSPNVLLRPIVQDTLFPTVAYVTGPNELAYLGQLRQAYRRFGVPMPLLHPRLSATVLDRAAVKFLGRYDVRFETLHAQDDGVLNRLIAAQLPPEVDAAVDAAERRVDEAMEATAAAVGAIDPTLTGAARTTRERMRRDLRSLRGKVVQAAKRRDATLRRQLRRTRAQAFPAGAPQERVVAFVCFLNRYGPGMVDRLLERLPLDAGRHWLVAI